MSNQAGKKIGVLLINLGTPAQVDTAAVRKYLREFLLDPRVVDLPWLVRKILVEVLIVPFRAKQSAHAYQAIWDAKGSPLLLNSINLRDNLQAQLGESYQIALGMRYGEPGIENALNELLSSNCDHITIVPLFPQYSSAATGSAIQAALQSLAKQWNIPSINVIADFFAWPPFIAAVANLTQSVMQVSQSEFLLMSYHGLPVRHLEKSGCSLYNQCELGQCPPITATNRYCYRAQCFATSQALAQALQLNQDQYQVSFQSRLGKTPWIKPYTDEVLQDLRKRGIRNLTVVCPSFVADCLETLEEIGIRAREQWRELGGHELNLVPCLNASALWINALAELIQCNSK